MIEAGLEIEEMLECLTERQRLAVRLWMQRMTYREIGLEMGISAQAAFYLVRRGLHRCSAITEAYG